MGRTLIFDHCLVYFLDPFGVMRVVSVFKFIRFYAVLGSSRSLWMYSVVCYIFATKQKSVAAVRQCLVQRQHKPNPKTIMSVTLSADLTCLHLRPSCLLIPYASPSESGALAGVAATDPMP